MHFSIIIPTYNRAEELRETIRSLAKLKVEGDWELLVVDNRSTDHTRTVVEEQSVSFPARLEYLFEPEQGRYAALNTGIRAARGEIIATTDDDARVEPDWLTTAAAGLDALGCDYVGGKVLPIWRGAKPTWLPDRPCRHWAVLALQDHGEEPVEFGRNGIPWPLGINTATRREAFHRTDLFDNRLGRKAGTLRNQAQREWHLRARAAGLRGFYVPEMIVHHVVEAERLKKPVLPPVVLLARYQPRDPVRKARRRHGLAGQFVSRLFEGTPDRRRAAPHVPDLAGPREGSDRRATARRPRGCVRARTVALVLRRHRSSTLDRAQTPDPATASHCVVDRVQRRSFSLAHFSASIPDTNVINDACTSFASSHRISS